MAFEDFLAKSANAISESAHGSGTLPVTEFGIVTIAALIFGLITDKFGLSSSIGFILAGLALGGQGLGFISASGISTTLGEIGLLTVLFYLGMELNLKKFKEIGGTAAVLSIISILGSFTVGFIVAQLFGFKLIESILIGTLLMAPSTVEALKFILEKNVLHTIEAKIAISSLVVSDLIAVLLVVFLTSIASQQSFNETVLYAIIFVIALLFVVSRVSKIVLDLLYKWGHENKMVLFALATGVIVSYLGELLGLSAIIGAYFAGFALAETQYAEKIKRELSFFRELFILFFFVSFGAKVLLPTSIATIALIIALIVGYLLVKFLLYGVIGTAIGINASSAIAMAAILTPIGEFGIIIASIAQQLHTQNANDLLSLAFMLTIVTTTLSPSLFKRTDAITNWFLKIYPAQVRSKLENLSYDAQVIQSTVTNQVTQIEHVKILQSMIINLGIAASIAYLAFILKVKITLPFLHNYIPTDLALPVLLIPIIIIPIYRFFEDLKTLTRKITLNALSLTFKPKNELTFTVEHTAAELVDSLILTMIGIITTIGLYTYGQRELLVLLIPAIYTIISTLYFSRSLNSIIKSYVTYEPDDYNSKPSQLSKDFKKQSIQIQNLNQTRLKANEKITNLLKIGDKKEARKEFNLFKKHEQSIIKKLQTK